MNKKKQKLYYFDYQATTPIDKRVIKEMNNSMKQSFGNPHSSSHPMGWESFAIVENARNKIAKVINANHDEIIFTSGATEANNIAIKGVIKFYQSTGKNHIITMTTEHKCVLETCKYLAIHENCEITYLNPESDGRLDMDKLQNAITDKTLLISIMGVNNETGVIQDFEKIGKIALKNNILFHTDCAQAYGKIPIDVRKMNIDLLSISGHKIYGPKGIGALFMRKINKKIEQKIDGCATIVDSPILSVRREVNDDIIFANSRVRVSTFMHGGGQERGVKSGTLPTFLIAGFAKAAEIIDLEYKENNLHVTKLQNIFLNEILQIEDCYLNGNIKYKIPECNNISILHIEGESLMMAIANICVSTGSACDSGALEPSYVIVAMRNDSYYAHSSIRFGFGKMTTEKEVLYLIKSLKKAINHTRKMSPLWEMKQNGIDINSISWGKH